MLFSQLKRKNHKLHVHTNDRLSPGLLTQIKKSGGIPPIPPGIPTGILEPPAWDPALNPRWDPANPTRDPRYILGKIPSIPHGIRPLIPGGIPPIPPGNPASFHAKSRQSHLATFICPCGIPPIPPGIPKFVPAEIPSGILQSQLGSLVCDPNRIPLIEFFNNPQIPAPALEHV